MTTLTYAIPQSGQLNSTEDPKVATALTLIQNWAGGNVDSGNLSSTAGILRSQLAGGGGNLAVTTTTTNKTAVDGTLYVVNAGSVTITLPSPTTNATVGVFAGSGQTGSAPVTISGSTTIIGAGLNATSMTLGSVGSYVLLQGIGTSWIIVAGQQDMGWVTLSLGSFAATHGSDTPAGRLAGDRVWLRGAIDLAAGGSPNSLATLPASMKPTGATFLPGAMFQSPNYFATFFTVNTSTGVLSTANSGTAPISFYFDGCSYTLS